MKLVINLERILKTEGLDLKGLRNKTDIDYQILERMYHGNELTIRLDEIVKIIKALDCRLEDVLYLNLENQEEYEQYGEMSHRRYQEDEAASHLEAEESHRNHEDHSYEYESGSSGSNCPHDGDCRELGLEWEDMCKGCKSNN